MSAFAQLLSHQDSSDLTLAPSPKVHHTNLEKTFLGVLPHIKVRGATIVLSICESKNNL